MDRQGVTGRNFDLMDRPANDRFHLEPEVCGAERIELDECVAELFPRRLGDRDNFDDIKAIYGALVGQVCNTLGDKVVGMRRDR